MMRGLAIFAAVLAMVMTASAARSQSDEYQIEATAEEDTTQNRRIGPRFTVQCAITTQGAFDPMFDPPPGEAHDHIFWGAQNVNPDSTIASLEESESSCTHGIHTQAYWTVFTYDSSDGFQELQDIPTPITVYYKGWGDQTQIKPLPRGLKMRTFDEHYRCGGPGNKQIDDPPYGCTLDQYRIVYHFPECWNGKSAGSQSMRFAEKDECPEKFPTHLPKLVIEVNYDNSDDLLSKPLRVSAGSGDKAGYDFAHANVMEAPQQPEFNRFVRMCIRDVADDELRPDECP